ncbi:MAG: DEAD/DEAH box helicase, partial [Alphaproteobacteria bacterium]|nr:DEAD/DEAH box helicase [Alphaproteobacteria bacterium]
MTDFSGLALAQPILRAIRDEGYTTPTPIQQKSIPALLAGRDLLGVAQTGTGKTAAFALPLLHYLEKNTAGAPRKAQHRQPRALILAPTRELASQIGDSLRSYGRHLSLRTTTVFGGTSIRPQ